MDKEKKERKSKEVGEYREKGRSQRYPFYAHILTRTLLNSQDLQWGVLVLRNGVFN